MKRPFVWIIPVLSAVESAVLGMLVLAGTCRVAEAIGLRVSAPKVGKYEKVEFQIDVSGRYENPFDPEEIDVTVVIGSEGRRYAIPAFYCQQYERRTITRGDRQVAWMYPVGEPVWKARFTPVQLGEYEAAAALKDRSGKTFSPVTALKCVASARKGFVRVSRKDARFLEFSDGQPFFPIGQNLAFIGLSQYAGLPKAEKMFAALAGNGANYLRIWTCCEDWAMAIEARKSAWGRSWDWRPPFAPVPGEESGGRKCVKLNSDRPTAAVSPSHEVALRPKTRYAASGRVRVEGDAKVRLDVHGKKLDDLAAGGPPQQWRPFRLEFETGDDDFWLGQMTFRLEGGGAARLDALSLQEAAGGPELLWEADPNRRVLGNYNPVDSFMLDEIVAAAEGNGLYLQLCMLTRDLYMNSLKDEKTPEYQKAIDDAKRFFRYAVARWGYSTSVAAWEYFNEQNPGLPTDRFYRELGEYLEEIDVYRHLRTTSAWGPSPKDWRHPKLDVADAHFYLRPADKDRLRDEVDAAQERTRVLREHAPAKPAHLGEFGLADDQWRPTEEMKTSRQVVDFHNALWASSLSGGTGTAMYWWWDRLDKLNAYPHYRPLADFVADVPWTTAGLQPTTAAVSPDRVRLVGLQGRDRAYFWLFNPQAAWSGVVIHGRTPDEIAGATVEIKDLVPRVYRVEWWDTQAGKVVKQESVTASGGALRLQSPAFRADVACKVAP